MMRSGRARPRPYAFLVKKPKIDRSYAALRDEISRQTAPPLPVPKARPQHAAKFPKARVPVGGPRP